MKTIISELVFDKEMVTKVKQANFKSEWLYNQLMTGKITMKEYLHLTK